MSTEQVMQGAALFTLMLARVAIACLIGISLTPDRTLVQIIAGILLLLLLICVQAGENAFVHRHSRGKAVQGWAGYLGKSVSDAGLTIAGIFFPLMVASSSIEGAPVSHKIGLVVYVAAVFIVMVTFAFIYSPDRQSILGSDPKPAAPSGKVRRQVGGAVGVGAVMVALALVILGAFLPPKRGIK